MKIRSGKNIESSAAEYSGKTERKKTVLSTVKVTHQQHLTKAHEHFNDMRSATPKSTVQSWQSRVIKQMNSATKRFLQLIDVEEERPGRLLRFIRSATATIAPIFLPKPSDVVAENYLFNPVENPRVPHINLDNSEAVQPCITGECVWPAYYDLTRPMAERKTVIYCPGGGYFVCHVNLHGAVSGRIARDAHCEVYALNYRLLPEHAYPAALNDVITLYNYLLAQGYKAENIILSGDSAGGHLAAVFVHHVQRCIKEKIIRGMELACGLLALLSPSLDFAMVNELEREHSDPLFPLQMIPLIGKKLASQLSLSLGISFDEVLKHPAISPVYLDLEEIGYRHPPVWAACDGSDVFGHGIDRFLAKLREHEVPERVHKGHVSHGGYVIAHHFPEADLMMRELTDTISHLFDTAGQRELDAQKAINEGCLDLQGFPL